MYARLLTLRWKVILDDRLINDFPLLPNNELFVTIII